jgi:hypothetical protein
MRQWGWTGGPGYKKGTAADITWESSRCHVKPCSRSAERTREEETSDQVAEWMGKRGRRGRNQGLSPKSPEDPGPWDITCLSRSPGGVAWLGGKGR